MSDRQPNGPETTEELLGITVTELRAEISAAPKGRAEDGAIGPFLKSFAGSIEQMTAFLTIWGEERGLQFELKDEPFDEMEVMTIGLMQDSSVEVKIQGINYLIRIFPSSILLGVYEEETSPKGEASPEGAELDRNMKIQEHLTKALSIFGKETITIKAFALYLAQNKKCQVKVEEALGTKPEGVSINLAGEWYHVDTSPDEKSITLTLTRVEDDKPKEITDEARKRALDLMKGNADEL